MLYMLLILAVGGLCECVTEVKVGGGGDQGLPAPRGCVHGVSITGGSTLCEGLDYPTWKHWQKLGAQNCELPAIAWRASSSWSVMAKHEPS